MLSIIIGNFIPPDGDSGLLAVVFYNGTKEEGKEFFKPLYELKPIGDTTATGIAIGGFHYETLGLVTNAHRIVSSKMKKTH
jgi:hypothetical protein